MSEAETFARNFKAATGNLPFPYQTALATAPEFPELLSVPTGLGKTAAAILAWLHRRRFASPVIQQATPRRLVYCLPMRTLVEQTRDSALRWLQALDLLEGEATFTDNNGPLQKYELPPDRLAVAAQNRIAVHTLMGGHDDDHWDAHPERDAILIGTQDMLLSRALNRGYGMSRYRWPIHFALLNNDCLWVMDETQLMGVGLTTTAQLDGLRKKLTVYGPASSLWMSATLATDALATVDHPVPKNGLPRQSLTDGDHSHPVVKQRLSGKKPLSRCGIVLNGETDKRGYTRELAAQVIAARKEKSLTLVVLNRVARAQAVFTELQKRESKDQKGLDLALIHARFRPRDRKQQEDKLFSREIPAAGRIVVATQAIEAGVDVSATTMFTELAPWSSMVQRFGRGNRTGQSDNASVTWIDITLKDEKDKLALPYALADFETSRAQLAQLSDVGLQALAGVYVEAPLPVVHTIRRKDLLDLWDTTPDLAGNDLDVSRFIRDGDDTDVQFYWRDLGKDAPAVDSPAPARRELCAVSVGAARDFLKKKQDKKESVAWIWKPLDRNWEKLAADDVRPGQVILLEATAGGYRDDLGWTGVATDLPTPYPPETGEPNPSNDDEPASELRKWVKLADHLNDVTTAVSDLSKNANGWFEHLPWPSLVDAARWHDVGKAHPAFANMLLNNRDNADELRESQWAKSDGKVAGMPRYWVDGPTGEERRIGFRHELASALAWLANHDGVDNADLVAYLIAAHHGKVRLSIRSLPNEEPPPDVNRRFARGVWHGDVLPAVSMADGETMPETTLDLSLMELGERDGRPSWLARVLSLRDNYGPFRLSIFETLLRVADWRGSAAGDK